MSHEHQTHGGPLGTSGHPVSPWVPCVPLGTTAHPLSRGAPLATPVAPGHPWLPQCPPGHPASPQASAAIPTSRGCPCPHWAPLATPTFLLGNSGHHHGPWSPPFSPELHWPSFVPLGTSGHPKIPWPPPGPQGTPHLILAVEEPLAAVAEPGVRAEGGETPAALRCAVPIPVPCCTHTLSVPCCAVPMLYGAVPGPYLSVKTCFFFL